MGERKAHTGIRLGRARGPEEGGQENYIKGVNFKVGGPGSVQGIRGEPTAMLNLIGTFGSW